MEPTEKLPLDLLAIGTSQEIAYKELIADFPDFNTMYIDAEDSPLETIADIFIALNPKRTLIYGEFDNQNVALLDSLLKLKKPEQKIFIAAYFGVPKIFASVKSHHLRMPGNSKYILQKFDEKQ